MPSKKCLKQERKNKYYKEKELMNSVDKQYLELLSHILKNGTKKSDRTGTGTLSIFDYTMRFDMREGFPLLTSKKMFTKGIIHELIWFLRGDTNIRYLVENGVHIWDGDAYKNFRSKSNQELTKEEFINKIKSDKDFANKWGELGPVYGKQWRKWTQVRKRYTSGAGLVAPYETIEIKYVDQIQYLINDLRSNPDSRRLMVSAWNPGDIDQMVLPPCHYGFQCWTREMTTEERLKLASESGFSEKLTEQKLDALRIPKRYLSLKWTQRSIDLILGLPFNISSYGLLLHLISKEVNMVPLDLIFSGGDCHIYLNHIDQVKEQLNRPTHDLCKLHLHNKSLEDLKFEDVVFENYKSSGILKADLSN